jgi:DNA-binding response OmpR family regulator
MRAAVRRAAGPEAALVFVHGEPTVDLAQHHVTMAGREVLFTPTVCGWLRVLVAHAGKVLTH